MLKICSSWKTFDSVTMLALTGINPPVREPCGKGRKHLNKNIHPLSRLPLWLMALKGQMCIMKHLPVWGFGRVRNGKSHYPFNRVTCSCFCKKRSRVITDEQFSWLLFWVRNNHPMSSHTLSDSNPVLYRQFFKAVYSALTRSTQEACCARNAYSWSPPKMTEPMPLQEVQDFIS